MAGYTEPEWLNLMDDEEFEALIRTEIQDEEDEDIPLDEMYLVGMEQEPDLRTASELHLAEGLSSDKKLYGQLQEEGQWANFVRFVKKHKREILGRGYETPEQCYYAYNHYMESTRRHPGEVIVKTVKSLSTHARC